MFAQEGLVGTKEVVTWYDVRFKSDFERIEGMKLWLQLRVSEVDFAKLGWQFENFHALCHGRHQHWTIT